MTPTTAITLRRALLGEILEALPGDACRVLLHLAHHACPATGRTWTDPSRIAERLDLPVLAVDEMLAGLLATDHLSLWAKGSGALRCYELGLVFVRAPIAPRNLPVEPDP